MIKSEEDAILAQADAINARRAQTYKEEADAVQERQKKILAGDSGAVPFVDSELVYAAVARCDCGAGYAYPQHCGPFHYWDCSAIMKGVARTDMKHSPQYPFSFYDIKSEGQPSANGKTTRPKPDAGA